MTQPAYIRSNNRLVYQKFLYALIYKSMDIDPDKINGVYDGIVNRKEASREAVRSRVDIIVQNATGKVLDIGCSGGVVSMLIARRGCDVTGIDFMEASLIEANELRAKEPPSVQARLYFTDGLAEFLEYPDEHFDTVIMGEVLEHVLNPRRVLIEAMRVLKPGGKFLASVPVGYNRTKAHLRWFDEGMFEALLQDYIKVLTIQNFSDIQMLAICRKE